MGLKNAYASIEDVPQEFRALPWKEDPATKRVELELELDKGYTLLGPKGTNALEEERKGRREADAKARELEQRLKDFEGVDAKAAREAFERVKDLEAQLGTRGQEAEKLFAERLQREKKAVLDEATKQIEAERGRSARRLQFIEASIQDRLGVELAAAKALGGGKVLAAYLKDRVKIREEGDRIITEIVGDTGAPRYSPNDATQLMTIPEFVAEIRKDESYAMYFDGSGSRGANTEPGKASKGSEPTVRRITQQQFDAMPLDQKAAGGYEVI